MLFKKQCSPLLCLVHEMLMEKPFLSPQDTLPRLVALVKWSCLSVVSKGLSLVNLMSFCRVQVKIALLNFCDFFLGLQWVLGSFDKSEICTTVGV